MKFDLIWQGGIMAVWACTNSKHIQGSYELLEPPRDQAKVSEA